MLILSIWTFISALAGLISFKLLHENGIAKEKIKIVDISSNPDLEEHRDKISHEIDRCEIMGTTSFILSIVAFCYSIFSLIFLKISEKDQEKSCGIDYPTKIKIIAQTNIVAITFVHLIFTAFESERYDSKIGLEAFSATHDLVHEV
jgi:amino acid transporter